MTKVKLPRKVAKAIEALRSDGYADTQIVYEIEANKADHVLADYFFEKATPDELMQALVNGYEVEQAPERALIDLFDAYQDIDEFDGGVRFGIVSTLDILGIKIGGINE